MAVAQINVGFQVNLKELSEKLVEAARQLEQFQDKFAEVGNSIGKVGVYVGRYVDRMSGTVISSIGAIISFIPQIVLGIAKVNAVVMSNPWIALSVAILAAGAAIYLYTRRGNEAVRMQKMLNDINVTALKNTAQEKAELDTLLKTAKDEKRLKADRLEAIKKLNQLAPEYLGNITLENVNTKKTTEAIREYIDAINAKAREQALMAKKTELFQKQIEVMNRSAGETGFVQEAFNAMWEAIGLGSNVVIRTREELEEYLKTLNTTPSQLATIRAAYEPYFKQKEREIELLQKQINQLDTYANAEKNAFKSKENRSVISFYEEQIRGLRILQKETAETSVEYDKLQAKINDYQKKINAIDGGKEKKKSNNKRKIVVDTIEFFNVQIEALRTHQSQLAKTADEYGDIETKIEAIQKKIDAITGKREVAVSLAMNIEPVQEGTIESYKRQIEALEKMRDATRLGSIEWMSFNNQIKDIEFEIKAKMDHSSFDEANQALDNFIRNKEKMEETTAKVMQQNQEEAEMYASAVGDAFNILGDNFINSMGESESALAQFTKMMLQNVIQIITASLAQSQAQGIANATQSASGTGLGAVFAQPAFIAMSIAGILAAFASIPKFANGGIAYGPVVGLMGEYVGASRNPEVIAPLNKLKDLIEPANSTIRIENVLGGGFRISGSDLQLVLDRYAAKKKRLG